MRIVDDFLISEMFRAMGCGFRYRDIRAKPTRLGTRNTNKKRAIKVEMSSEEVVEDIIANKNKLKNRNENFYAVYVNRDLCREERQKEIDERRAKNSRVYRDSAGGAGIHTGGVGETRQSGGSGSGQPNRVAGAEPVPTRGAIEGEERGRELEGENGEIVNRYQCHLLAFNPNSASTPARLVTSSN